MAEQNNKSASLFFTRKKDYSIACSEKFLTETFLSNFHRFSFGVIGEISF